MTVNTYIDHTLLKPDATLEQIEKLIAEAKKYEFASVCVNPTWVKTATDLLKDSSVKAVSYTHLDVYKRQGLYRKVLRSRRHLLRMLATSCVRHLL